jgi:hypothetical protein
MASKRRRLFSDPFCSPSIGGWHFRWVTSRRIVPEKESPSRYSHRPRFGTVRGRLGWRPRHSFAIRSRHHHVERFQLSAHLSGDSTSSSATDLICTNTSGPPASGMMKPSPRSALKNFTVPLVIFLLPAVFEVVSAAGASSSRTEAR